MSYGILINSYGQLTTLSRQNSQSFVCTSLPKLVFWTIMCKKGLLLTTGHF